MSRSRPFRLRPSRTATAGSAAAGGLWSPWAQDTDTTVTYSLRSGATCEERLGDVRGADPAMTSAIQDDLAGVDLQS